MLDIGPKWPIFFRKAQFLRKVWAFFMFFTKKRPKQQDVCNKSGIANRSCREVRVNSIVCLEGHKVILIKKFFGV